MEAHALEHRITKSLHMLSLRNVCLFRKYFFGQGIFFYAS